MMNNNNSNLGSMKSDEFMKSIMLFQNPNSLSDMGVNHVIMQDHNPTFLQDNNANWETSDLNGISQHPNLVQKRQMSFGNLTYEELWMESGAVEVNPSYDLAPSPLPAAAVLQTYAYNNAIVVNREAAAPTILKVAILDHPVNGEEKRETGNEKKRGKTKRIIDDKLTEEETEKSRQRMIRNRESAARSRLRKQSYAIQLESELNTLRAENTRVQNHVLYVTKIMEEQEEEMKQTKAKGKAQKPSRCSSC